MGRRPKRPRDESSGGNQSWIKNEEYENEGNKSANEYSQQMTPRIRLDQQQESERIGYQKIIKKEEQTPKTIKSKNKETLIKNNRNSALDINSALPYPPFSFENKLLMNNHDEGNCQKYQQSNEFKFHKQDSYSSFRNFEFTKNSNQTVDISILLSFIEVADEYLSMERNTQLEYIRSSVIEAYTHIWPTTQDKIQARLRECTPILKPKQVIISFPSSSSSF